MSERNLIFLSYANPDLEIAKEIYAGLTKRKLKVWFDKKSLKKGKWKSQVEDAIANSSDFLFCMSNESLKRHKKKQGFQYEEFEFAYRIAMAQPENNFSIIPIRLENCDRGDLRVTSFYQFDVFEDFERKIDQLAIQIGGISLFNEKEKDIRMEDEKLIENLFNRAQVAFFAKEFNKSLSICNTIIQIYSKHYLAWNNSGVILNKLGKQEAALTYFAHAIQLNPNYAMAWFNWGVSLSDLERHTEALKFFNEAIKLKPDYFDAWINRGWTLDNLGKQEESLNNYNEAIRLKPNDYVAWYNRGLLLFKMERFEESIRNYDEAIKLRPDFAHAWNNRGVTLEKLGRSEEAQESFKRADEFINPEP